MVNALERKNFKTGDLITPKKRCVGPIILWNTNHLESVTYCYTGEIKFGQIATVLKMAKGSMSVLIVCESGWGWAYSEDFDLIFGE